MTTTPLFILTCEYVPNEPTPDDVATYNREFSNCLFSAAVDMNINVKVDGNEEKIETVTIPIEVRIETSDANRHLSTTTESKQLDNSRLYVAIASGVGSFGTYSHVKINSGGVVINGIDFAYFFSTNIGAGLKWNVASCKANFREFGDFYYKEQINFVGPTLYGKIGNNGTAFTFSTGVGLLKWNLTEVLEINSSADNESYSSAGGFISAGFCYMLTQYIGLNLNIQTIIGSLEDQYGNERKPTGIGGTLGINFKF